MFDLRVGNRVLLTGGLERRVIYRRDDGAVLVENVPRIRSSGHLSLADEWFDNAGRPLRSDRVSVVICSRCPDESDWPKTHTTFSPGDRVRKIKGSRWQGRVVGWYSTSLTPEGYAVESETELGSVQIYPVSALALVASAAELASAAEAADRPAASPARLPAAMGRVTIDGPGQTFGDVVLAVVAGLEAAGAVVSVEDPYPVPAEHHERVQSLIKGHRVQVEVRHSPWGG